MSEMVKFGGGEFQPSTAKTGNDNLGTVLRGRNMLLRGSNDSYYFESYAGHRNLNEPIPIYQLTGTLSYLSNSNIVNGTGTLFKSELRFGQKVLVGTQVLVVDNIPADDVFYCQRPTDATESNEIGYKMPLLFEIDNQRGSLIWGNAYKTDKGNIVAVGEGQLRINGLPLPGEALVASRKIKLAIYNPLTAQYSVEDIGFQTAPQGVTVNVVAGGIKDASLGYYSFRFAWANFDTAFGFSNPSEVVKFDGAGNQIQLTSPNQKFEIDFSAALLTKPVNADSVIIYRSLYSDATLNSTQAGEGSWFVAARIKISDFQTGDIVFVDVLDGELDTEITFDNDPPPDADWLSFLASDPILISCYGEATATNADGTSPGAFISPSKRGNRDAFPAEISVPLSPPDTIIGFVAGSVTQDSTKPVLFLMTRISLPIAVPTNNPEFPVITQAFWQTGFHSPFGLVLVNDVLYAFTTKGVTRSVTQASPGNEQFDLAASVGEITKEWYPGYVHAVHDRKNELVLFIYSAAERDVDGWWISLALPFYLRFGIFGPLIEISKPNRDMVVCGAANVGGKMQFLAGGRGGSATPFFGGTMSDELIFPAAGRYGSDILTFWDLPATNAPIPVAVGTNVLKAVLEFSNSITNSCETHLLLPEHWIGLITVKIFWSTGQNSGNMKWQVQTSYTDVSNANDADDNVYNTADTVITPVSASPNDEIISEILSVNITGAVAGSPMHIKLTRDPADAADTCNGVVYLNAVKVILRRNN